MEAEEETTACSYPDGATKEAAAAIQMEAAGETVLSIHPGGGKRGDTRSHSGGASTGDNNPTIATQV